MSRALLALLRGDLACYAEYNIMAFPVMAVFVCEIFGELFGRYKMALHVCSITVLAVNLLYYFIRLKTGII